MLQPKPSGYLLFSNIQKTFTKLTKLDHKATFNMFQIEIILSLFSDHLAIKLEISNQKIKILGKGEKPCI